MASRFSQHWFLITLISIIGIGITFPSALGQLAENIPRHYIVAGVLFLMALPLEFKVLWGVVKSPWMVFLATALNYGLIPPLAWILSKWMPHGFAAGVIIAAAVPCTMASAAVWTRRAGGNDAIALFVTMVTNISCFLATPALIALYLGTEVDLDVTKMVIRLAKLVVVPIVFAQMLRAIPYVAKEATIHKKFFSTAAQLGLLSIVFVGAVKSGEQLQQADANAISIGDWILMAVGMVSIHLIVLFIARYLSKLFGANEADSCAVAIASSQKTLMVGLDLSIEYAAIFGGLAVIPMVVYHIGQLFVDTLIADYWRKNSQKSAEKD